MSDCTRFRQDLPLAISDDLGASRREALDAHLEGCTACAAELIEMKEVISSVRSLLEVKEGLAPGIVTRIATRAAEEVVRAPWWRRLAPPIPVHGWSAAVPAMLLMVVIAAPFVLSHGNVAPQQAQGPERLDMRLDKDGGLRVAWSNGHNRTYKVFKTTDPRLLGTGAAKVVKGHEWVDRDTESPAIVYYRVE
ncbi:MAG TPA: zf-HC2 domain-containing protein [Candidatus Polarisedimenticolia bacterium]|nr:zf-HC2 domain-containing protein [Candidatus Polarisedimenticolia bacterium]